MSPADKSERIEYGRQVAEMSGFPLADSPTELQTQAYANDSWKRWYDHLPKRMYMLRWYLLHGGKFWMDASFAAKLRGAYWSVVRGYDSEICSHCGRPVRLVFHVPDEIWEIVAGTKRTPDGEAGAGILCPLCVDGLYTLAVPRGPAGFLRWTCRADDSVMTDGTPEYSSGMRAADQMQRETEAGLFDDP